MDSTLQPFLNQVVVFTVCGDAEAYVFDFDALPAAQRTALVTRHLAAFSANLERRGRTPFEEFLPFAVLGESMPGAVQGAVDLSAPHEGALLLKRATGGVFYVAAADDLRAYFVSDTTAQLGFRESAVRAPGPAKVDFGGEPTVRTGFTLEQYELGGNKLAQVIGKHSGIIGLFERMFASS